MRFEVGARVEVLVKVHVNIWAKASIVGMNTINGEIFSYNVVCDNNVYFVSLPENIRLLEETGVAVPP